MNPRHQNGPPTTGAHVPALDGIRGLAVALVMVHHFFADSLPAETELDRIAFGVAHTGWCGVDLFFVLSGYLITGILFDTKSSPRYFRNFYARRTVRIFPLYYFTLFVFFVLVPQTNQPEILDYVADSRADQGWFWAYLTNVRVAVRGIFYAEHIPNLTWSLAIEEQFYLVWPVIVLLCARRLLMRICLALILVALALRTVLALNEVSWVVSYVLTPARMDCLAVGSFLSLFFRGSYRPETVVWARRVLLMTLVFVAWLGIREGELSQRDGLTYSLGFTGIALFYGALLVLSVTASPGAFLSRAFGNGFLRTLGKFSYALYLCHGPVGTAVRLIYHPRHQPLYFGSSLPRTLIYVFLAGVASIAVALLSWHLLEKHFLALKHRFGDVTLRPAPRRTLPAGRDILAEAPLQARSGRKSESSDNVGAPSPQPQVRRLP